MRKSNLFDGVSKAGLVGGKWHLMDKRHVGIVQLGDHVQQDVSACC